MKHKKRCLFPLFLSGVMILCGISAGLCSAYLSASTDTLQNVITSGTVQIRLLEENWKPDAQHAVVPGSVISKDPAIQNTGKNAAHVFLEIGIPIRSISIVDTNMQKQERVRTELFSFLADSKNWKQIKKYSEQEKMIYVYGYDGILYPQETTEPLFDTVTLVNYLEGELDAKEKLQIDVTAKAIQTSVSTVGESAETIYSILQGQLALEQACIDDKQEEIHA